jgi:hypothetical protein
MAHACTLRLTTFVDPSSMVVVVLAHKRASGRRALFDADLPLAAGVSQPPPPPPHHGPPTRRQPSDLADTPLLAAKPLCVDRSW